MASLEEHTLYRVELTPRELAVVVGCLEDVITIDDRDNGFIKEAEQVRAVLYV